MKISKVLSLFLLMSSCSGVAISQTNKSDQLELVVALTRHGVRAPLASEIRDNLYNAQPWPAWTDASGVLTQHGADALKLLGGFYRQHYASLLARSDCAHSTIYVLANNAQRTIASAHALAAGLEPDCSLEVHARPRPERDPLFTPSAFSDVVDHARLAAAISGRLGGHIEWWPQNYRVPLDDLQNILSNCAGADCDKSKKKLLDSRSSVETMPGGEMVSIETPVSIGADFAEHFLLQYTEGLPMEKVGWGRVSRPMLDHLMAMNTSYHDFVLQTPYFAQAAASDFAYRLSATLEQAASGRLTPDALAPAGDRFVLLSGHDGNLTWLSGLLQLSWLLPDQPRDATPPGSGLIFELYKNSTTGQQTVRVLFESQTLDQIRFLKPLDGNEEPTLVPVFVPGCSESTAGFPCDLKAFTEVVRGATDGRFVDHSGKP